MASGLDSAGWDRRYAGRDLVWTAEPNRFLVAETDALVPGRAIDLLCGEGRNAVWLAERGWQAVGVDFSPVGLEKARELAAERGVSAEWVVADLLQYLAGHCDQLLRRLPLHHVRRRVRRPHQRPR